MYMKRNFVIIGVVLVLAGIASLALVSRLRQVGPAATEEASATVEVSPIRSQVFVSAINGLSYEIATTTPVAVENHLKTSHTGRALVEGKHSSIIDSDTEILLASLDPDGTHTRIILEAGNIWSRVKKLTDKGEFYEIETQNAVAVVRGTSFGLSYLASTTVLVVTNGTVLFGPKDTESGELIEKSAVLVNAGTKAILVGSSDQVVLKNVEQDDVRSEWFIFNNPAFVLPLSAPKNRLPVKKPEPATTLPPQQKPLPVPTQVQKAATPDLNAETPPNLFSVSPAQISADTSTLITISGEAFGKVVSVAIGGVSISGFRIVNDSSIQVAVTLPAGTYDVAVADAAKHASALGNALVVIGPKEPQSTVAPSQNYYYGQPLP